MKIIPKFLKLHLPPILWAAVIFLLSSHPTGEASQIIWTDFIVKKTAHITEYMILTLLLYRSFVNISFSSTKSAIFSVALSVFYAATDEFHQSFTPGRMPRLYDIGFDTIGAILAIYALWTLLPKAPQRLKTLAKNLDFPLREEKS